MFRYVIILLVSLVSCKENRQEIKTPKEFLNHVTADAVTRSEDSAAIITDLYKMMKDHRGSFANPEYFDSTVLFIDTIMYDSSFRKIAFFVIAQNPVYRNPYADTRYLYYYNANCYLGKRIYADSNRFELKNIGPFSVINFYDKQLVSKAIRDDYFSALTTAMDENGRPFYEYNLDDKRFWESRTGWQRVFE